MIAQTPAPPTQQRFPLVLPLAARGEPVRYVTIDDEPRYRVDLGIPPGVLHRERLEPAGGYADVETFLALHREPCHVIVLDLCLNRRTGDTAVLHGVAAVRHLTDDLGHRVLVHTSDSRPEPVARCVAAGAAGYVSKYEDDVTTLARAMAEIGCEGRVHSRALTDAVAALTRRCRDTRLSATLEETLVMLDRGWSDAEIARRRNLSARTVEDHKRKILEIFGRDMEADGQGFAELTHHLGIGPGDLVNDAAGSRPARGLIRRATAWAGRQTR